jgi:hypothetical protein
MADQINEKPDVAAPVPEGKEAPATESTPDQQELSKDGKATTEGKRMRWVHWPDAHCWAPDTGGSERLLCVAAIRSPPSHVLNSS